MRTHLLIAAALAASVGTARCAPRDYFGISVADAVTGRGVPLVELRTVNEQVFVTDSNGIAAINEPQLMGHKVYFFISSHGYAYKQDEFGYRGVALNVVPGGHAVIMLPRLNIAERLYRITGAGIYRDSVLLGTAGRIRQPLLNGLVMGQDTVEVVPYRGKLYWFWGDTNKPSFPLGNFATSGATSELPGKGGLDPSVGIDLTYWVDKDGFSREMIPLEGGSGPVWVGGLFTLKDQNGEERLLTHYARVDHDMRPKEHGLALWDDNQAVFKKHTAYELNEPMVPEGHTFHARVADTDYIYFTPTNGAAAPWVRAVADMAHVTDPRKLEGFTCLAAGARYDGANTKLDRGADGRLVYGWKPGTPALSFDQQRELVAKGKMAAAEGPYQLRDIETDAPICPHGGSTYWNAYRKRWIMLFSQSGGKSYLGEMWFAEGDTPAGPWVYARHILTHDRYTFYNPTQHPFFDQDGGRLVYFEGTYVDTFSGNPVKTPLYNYNQIMYRLALDDARLALPVPVYHLARGRGREGYATFDGFGGAAAAMEQWPRVADAPFFALPHARRSDGTVALYAVSSEEGGRLQLAAPGAGARPVCDVLPPVPADGEKVSPSVVALYEYSTGSSGRRWYSTDGAGLPAGAVRADRPLCRVWRNPCRELLLDPDVQYVSP